jgi:hypothetical protein
VSRYIRVSKGGVFGDRRINTFRLRRILNDVKITIVPI